MVEPLHVDTSGLHAAAGVLGDLDVPAPPGPFAVAGTDAMSAAISSVLPLIEAPVSDGLPVAASALNKTAADMAAAADLYDETDKASAATLAQVQFAGDGPTARTQASSAAATATATSTGATAAATDTSAAAKPGVNSSEPLSGQPPSSGPRAPLTDTIPSAERAAQQLTQMAPMMGQVFQQMQGQVQGLMSKAQGGGQNPAAPPPPPAPDTTVEGPKDQEEQKTEEEQKTDEQKAPADGAASGRPDGSGVPIPDTAPPTATPSPGAAHSADE